MTAILKFLTITGTFAALLGIIFNFLLLYFIGSIQQCKLQAFSKALLQNCILDLILSLSTIVAQSQICIKGDIYYGIIGNTFYTPNYAATSIILCAWSGFLMLSLYALPVPFFVRYQIIVRKQATTRKHFSISYGIVFTLFFGLMTILLWCYPPIGEQYRPMESGLNDTFWIDEYGRIPSFVGSYLGSPSVLLCYFYVGVTSAMSYCLVIYFGVQITNELRKSELNMFSKTKLLHRQFHRAMIIQAASPFFAGTLPTVCLAGMVFFKYESLYFSLACSFATVWVPVVNPIAAIFIIGPYRTKLITVVPLLKALDKPPPLNSTNGLQLSLPSNNVSIESDIRLI